MKAQDDLSAVGGVIRMKNQKVPKDARYDSKRDKTKDIDFKKNRKMKRGEE
jgi:hypothetical protein